MPERSPDRRHLEPGDRVHVIANPATRSNVRDVFRMLTNALPKGVDAALHLTQRSESAWALADRFRAQADCMVAIGGDGTVSAVAAALHGTGIPLAIVPGGSTNIIARELGIPEHAEAAARLLSGRFGIRDMDVGVCNERNFLHMAGAGFDSRMFDMTDPELKKKVGWVAYLPAGLKALRKPSTRFHLTIDDEVMDVESPLVLVANGSSVISPRIKVGSDIRFDDGELDILVVTATKPHEIASVLARLAAGTMEASPNVLYRRARTMTMDAGQRIPIQLDGDVIEQTPARFSILPHGIRMIVPPGSGA